MELLTFSSLRARRVCPRKRHFAYVLRRRPRRVGAAPGWVYWDKLKIAPQCSHYLEAARALGYDARRVEYDVLIKPTLRPLLATPVDKRKHTKAGALYADQRAEDEAVAAFQARVHA